MPFYRSEAPFKKASLPALIQFICTYWHQPSWTGRPIDFTNKNW